MKKLTRAQQEVVDLLKGNPDGRYIRISDYRNGQQVIRRDPIRHEQGFNYHGMLFFTRPTFDVLLRINIIKPTDQKDIYVLSEKE